MNERMNDFPLFGVIDVFFCNVNIDNYSFKIYEIHGVIKSRLKVFPWKYLLIVARIMFQSYSCTDMT